MSASGDVSDSLVDLPLSHTYHLQGNFLVVTTKQRDIGLVGWKDRRWTHQDKVPVAKKRKPKNKQNAPAPRTAWSQAFDPDSRRYYFYNVSAGVTEWDEPEEGYVPDETVQYFLTHGIAKPYVSRNEKNPFSDERSCPHMSPDGTEANGARIHEKSSQNNCQEVARGRADLIETSRGRQVQRKEAEARANAFHVWPNADAACLATSDIEECLDGILKAVAMQELGLAGDDLSEGHHDSGETARVGESGEDRLDGVQSARESQPVWDPGVRDPDAATADNRIATADRSASVADGGAVNGTESPNLSGVVADVAAGDEWDVRITTHHRPQPLVDVAAANGVEPRPEPAGGTQPARPHSIQPARECVDSATEGKRRLPAQDVEPAAHGAAVDQGRARVQGHGSAANVAAIHENLSVRSTELAADLAADGKVLLTLPSCKQVEDGVQSKASSQESAAGVVTADKDVSPSSVSKHSETVARSTIPNPEPAADVAATALFNPRKKGELPRDVERYWLARYSLLSQWADGVRVNARSLFSITPEVIAKHHAQMLSGASVVFDAFCGCGGNAIQLARVVPQVIACDLDKEQLKMAKHNAAVYGVIERIRFVHGDAFELAKTVVADAVFISPPWGGPRHGDRGAKPLFDPLKPTAELGRNIRECLEMAASCLKRSASADQGQRQSVYGDESEDTDAELRRADTLAAGHPDDSAGISNIAGDNIARVPHISGDNTDGGNSSGAPNIVVYLPKDTSVSGLAGCLAPPLDTILPLCLERNVLNYQLKSLTLYARAMA